MENFPYFLHFSLTWLEVGKGNVSKNMSSDGEFFFKLELGKWYCTYWSKWISTLTIHIYSPAWLKLSIVDFHIILLRICKFSENWLGETRNFLCVNKITFTFALWNRIAVWTLRKERTLWQILPTASQTCHFHSCYWLLSIWFIASRRMRWAMHAARMGKINIYRHLEGKPKVKR